ncbi:50S ribosomal protein L32 [Candidatus Parcubacteria bacterium]|nr:50S ribosomal protein L32 [Candidatus Parcubacteria bacterium]
MSVPKKRRTKSSVGQRRSHHSLSSKKSAKCPKCGKAIQAHRACSFCGYYKGREVIKIKSKTKKKKS